MQKLQLPRAIRKPTPLGWSLNGLPLVPQYERGDVGGEYIRNKRK